MKLINEAFGNGGLGIPVSHVQKHLEPLQKYLENPESTLCDGIGYSLFFPFLDSVCISAGHPVDWKNDPILTSRGHLEKGHRLVKELDLRLPDWTSFVFIELKIFKG